MRHQELLDLINDLLALAESKTAGPERPLERLELQDALRSAVDRFREQAEAAGVSLQLDMPQEPVAVSAIGDGIGIVFGNLVGNAVKYTPRGGRVTVRLSQSQEGAAVSVEDSGIGIDTADLPRSGEEFFRASNAKRSGISGTGLGLTIVRHHLDRWGARLEAESKVGEGSTFRVMFPAIA